MSARLLLVGGGGLGVTACDLVRASGRGLVVGVLDDRADARGSPVLGVTVEGSFGERAEVVRRLGASAVLVTIGGLRHMLVRGRYLEALERDGLLAEALRHPTAVVGQGAVLGAGCIVGANVTVGPEVKLGRGCVLYSGSVLEHESVLGDNVYLAPGVLTGGRVTIGADCYLGIGARLVDGVRIGAGTIVGAGAVVLEDLPEGVVAYGVPARVIGPNTRYRSVG